MSVLQGLVVLEDRSSPGTNARIRIASSAPLANDASKLVSNRAMVAPEHQASAAPENARRSSPRILQSDRERPAGWNAGTRPAPALRRPRTCRISAAMENRLPWTSRPSPPSNHRSLIGRETVCAGHLSLSRKQCVALKFRNDRDDLSVTTRRSPAGAAPRTDHSQPRCR